MKLQLERKTVETLAGQFPRLASLKDQLRFGNKAEAAFSHFSHDEVSFLRKLYEEAGPDFRARAAQLATLQKALNDDGIKFDSEDLELLVPAIARYLAADAIRGWLFQANVSGKPMAYVVTRLDFTPPGNEETGKVLIELKANAKGKLALATLRIYASDIANRTIAEIFVAKGFLKETPELIATYDEAAGRYFDWRARYARLSHKKFTCKSIDSKAPGTSANFSMAAWKFFGIVFRINSMARPRNNPMTWAWLPAFVLMPSSLKVASRIQLLDSTPQCRRMVCANSPASGLAVEGSSTELLT